MLALFELRVLCREALYMLIDVCNNRCMAVDMTHDLVQQLRPPPIRCMQFWVQLVNTARSQQVNVGGCLYQQLPAILFVASTTTVRFRLQVCNKLSSIVLENRD